MKNYHEQDDDNDQIEFCRPMSDWKILLIFLLIAGGTLAAMAIILTYIFA